MHELVRLDDALAPESAARLRGVDIPSVADLVDDVVARGVERDSPWSRVPAVRQYGWTLVGGTIATLPSRCGRPGTQVEVLVVTSLGLGTLNHTELTVDALRRQGLEPSGLALGAVPGELGLAERCNLDDLPRLTGVPVVARIPAGAGALGPAEFCAAAPTWIL